MEHSSGILETSQQQQRHAHSTVDAEGAPAAARLRSIVSASAGPVHVSTSRNTVPAATQSVALPVPPLPVLLPALSLPPLPVALPPPSLPLSLPPYPSLLPLRPPLLLPCVALVALPRCHLRSMEYSNGAVTQRSCNRGVSTCGTQSLS